MVILLGCQTGLKPAVLWLLHWYAFLSTSMSYCYRNSNAFSSGILALLTGSQFEIPVPSITGSIECKTDSHFQLTDQTGYKSEDNFILSGSMEGSSLQFEVLWDITCCFMGVPQHYHNYILHDSLSTNSLFGSRFLQIWVLDYIQLAILYALNHLFHFSVIPSMD